MKSFARIRLDDLLAHARRTDPETSHAAAKSLAKPALNRLETIIVAIIRGRGLRGATCDEIVSESGLAWNTVSPRLAPLRRRKMITPMVNINSETLVHRRGASGRQQIVWFVI